ncbi:MAG: hypothetical protein ABIH23_34125 [bacterium]
MMMWVIGGACRGVGKTWLSTELARLLPEAVCAKIGHNPPKQAGPKNYFTCIADFQAFLATNTICCHCVVESNELIRQENGDIRIFIDAPADMNDIREDVSVLKSKTDIVIDTDSCEDTWRQVLKRKRGDPALIPAICALLQQQKQFVYSDGCAEK